MDIIERHDMYYPGAEGCSDGGCIFKDNSKGMRTNGGCKCEKELRRHPQGLNAIRTINFLRGQLRKTAKETESLRAKLAEAEQPLDADWLSNVIRSADGNNTLGAGSLAEKIIDAIQQAKMRGEGQ